MKDTLKLIVKEFLQAHCLFQSPLLLGYSGGPDSKALLYALLECQKEIPFSLHLAHVDHGWRKESHEEAMELKKEAEKLKIPFHLCKLSLEIEKNREGICREKRLIFFSEIMKKIQGEALLLAHQKNDVSETVLKRLLEGAHLPHLYGIKPSADIYQMKVLRPLLSVEKEEIYQFLKENHLSWLEDSTNLSERYLRGRMRKSLFPLIEEHFGKKAKENLYLLAKRSEELSDYLQSKLSPYLARINRGPFGKWLEIHEELHLFEKRHLLIQFLGFTPKRGDLEKMLTWVEQKEPAKEIQLPEGSFHFDRGVVFSLQLSFPGLFHLHEEGAFEWGNWQITIQKCSHKSAENSHWKDFLSGKAEFYLPNDCFILKAPHQGKDYGSFKKWWSEHQVPMFLRDKLPAVYKADEPFQELLTGKKQKNKKEVIYLKVILNYK